MGLGFYLDTYTRYGLGRIMVRFELEFVLDTMPSCSSSSKGRVGLDRTGIEIGPGSDK